MEISVIVTCLMGQGTFEAKLIPLANSPLINRIIVLRKIIGPPINKVEYIKLPRICRINVFNLLITPLLLIYHTKKNKVDLILSYHFIPHAIFAFIASFFTKVPYNVTQTGLYIERYARMKKHRSYILGILNRSLFINVPGYNSKEFWVKNGIEESKIYILHSKIDTRVFKPGYSKKHFDFIYLGRLSKEKRVNLIVQGIYKLKNHGLNVKLAIVGDGPEMKELKKLTHILNLNEDVTFTGFVKDPASWFNKAKIFLLCSESEALPTALMQAMSCKLIVIAPNIGNISCLVENNHNGYLFDVDDISSFYELMKEVYINYYSLIHITENARKKILLEYTHENATIIWNEIIKSKFIIT